MSLLSTARSLARYVRHSSLHRNSFWIMVAIALTSGLGYAYWVAVAHIYPAHEVGIASALIALMTVAAILFNLGMAPVLVQRLPRCETIEDWSLTLSACLVGTVCLGLIAGLLAFALLPVISPRFAVAREDPATAFLFVAGTSLWGVTMALDYAFIAERRSRSMSTRGALFALAKIPLVTLPALALPSRSGVAVILGSWILAAVISCVISLAFVVPWMRPGFRLRLAGTGAELRGMVGMLAGNHLITLGNYLPIYLLPVVVVSRLSASANAYFYITWMVGGIFFMISSSVGSSLFAEGSNSPAGLSRAARASARFTALLLAPAMLIAFVAGSTILSLFGAAYSHHGTPLLWVLALAAIPDAITNLYVPLLRVRDRLRAAACLTMGMAGATIVAAWLLAPSLKLIGVGLAWLGGQALGSLWVGWDLLARRRPARAPLRLLDGVPN